MGGFLVGGLGWGLNNLHPCQNVKKLFNIFDENILNIFLKCRMKIKN
jgi:hypothetical protein